MVAKGKQGYEVRAESATASAAFGDTSEISGGVQNALYKPKKNHACSFQQPSLFHISLPVPVNASAFLGSPGKLSLYHSFQSLSISL